MGNNMSEMKKILVLCTGNSCRSQMAEGYIRKYGGEQVVVHSAGLEPHGLNPRAVRVMREVGIDISGHSSDHLNEYLDETFDYVITVCDNAARNCPVFPGDGARQHWPFEDPAGASGTEEEILGVFRRVRDEIGERIRVWLEGIHSGAADRT